MEWYFASEAATQMCSYEKVFWKYAANLQENTHPCRSVILIKLQSNFIEITLRHGCSSVKLLHVSRTPFPRNASGWLFLSLRSSREVWRRLQAIMIDNGQYYCRVKKWKKMQMQEKCKKLNSSLVDLIVENTVVE